MSKGRLASILIWTGLFMIGIIFLADAIGISEIITGKESPGFGIHQISGIILGIIITTIGWFLKRKSL